MKTVTGLNDTPNQTTNLLLADGSSAVLSLTFKSQQLGWFFDLTWGANFTASGQRLVASPNILRQYINQIPFGISVVTSNNLDPASIESFVDGSTTFLLLEGADLSDVETALFNGPVVPAPPAAVSSQGSSITIPPSQWGPAGGDLSGNYPNPVVVEIHEAGGQGLAIGAVPDGDFLKRVGGTIVGAAGGGGGGPPSGPAGGDLAGSYPDPTVVAIEETGGARLAIGAVPDGEFLKRVGAAVVGAAGTLTGPAGGDLGSNYPNPTVLALEETSTPARLLLAGIPDGTFFKRVGATVVGATPAGAGTVTGPVSSVDGNAAVWNGATGTVLKDAGAAPLLSGQDALVNILDVVANLRVRANLVYPTGGAITLDFGGNNRIYIGLTANATFSSTNRADSRFVVLDLTNTTGGNLTLSWPGAWKKAAFPLPGTINAGVSMRLYLECYGTGDANISAYYVALPVPVAPYGDYNVVAYGADPSGATSSFAAINLAITALNVAGKGRLVFPAGNYTISGALNSVTVPCEIVGSGQSNTVITQTDGVHSVFTVNCNNGVWVHGIYFNGNGTSSNCLDLTGSAFNSSSLIDACTFVGGSIGLNINGAFTNVTNCIIACNIGVLFDNAVNRDESAGLIQGCTIGSAQISILIRDDGLQIIGNYIIGGQVGIQQEAPNGAQFSDLWIEANHIENMTVKAINIVGPTSSGGFNNIVIVGNEFSSPGIQIDISITGVSNWLNCVTITGNAFNGCGTNGIKVYECNCVTITGNVFSVETPGVAVYIDASASNGYVGNSNRFRGSGTPLINNGGFDT
jgi:hypothetical protein